MTIEELKTDIAKGEAELIADEAQVKTIRAAMQTKHDALEAKRAMLPVTATPNDQVITPGKAESPLDFVLNLPAAIRDSIKAALNGVRNKA